MPESWREPVRIPLLVLAGLIILGGNVLIAAVARSIPIAVFAGRPAFAWVAALLIVAGVGLVLWTNLRHAA